MISHPWAEERESVLRELDTGRETGLDRAEARRRLDQQGQNLVEASRAKSAWTILRNQFESVVVLLLGAAAIGTFLIGRWVEGAAISAVVVVNAVIGFWTELRAVRSMESLRALSRARARVRRQGRLQDIPAEHVVVGDIVLLEAGDKVPADARVLEAARLQVDESALTGESEPRTKQEDAVERETPVADRLDMLYKGTAVTRGSGEAVVTATGPGTELGRIASQIKQAQKGRTELEKGMDRLGRSFVWLTVVLSAVVIPAGWLTGKDPLLVVETAAALAVAAIPEGLPIVLTLALARGMRRMARRRALIRRLSAVGTLGSVNVIATDKTGTLTENQMTVRGWTFTDQEVDVSGEGLDTSGEFVRDGESLDPTGDERPLHALRIGVLCGNAELRAEDDEVEGVGDPMEVALLVAGAKAGIEKERLLEDLPETREVAFDPEIKMMATVHETGEGFFFAVKGAAEAVLDVCDQVWASDGPKLLDDATREEHIARSRRLGARGHRVLALAEKTGGDSNEEAYEGLVFVALCAMVDPPRAGVKESIRAAHGAGVRTVMVTGDQPETAQSIAEALGLQTSKENGPQVVEGRDLDASESMSGGREREIAGTHVFARVSPKQKLDLVSLHQDLGRVVAMTGDGVNDAPALEKADIGIAMGLRGTQVAREAADVILQDDAFSTIVTAIRQGRVIFGNLRSFVLFLLTVSLSMIIAVFVASLGGWTMPVLPLQVLFLNAVTHVFPALAIGMGEGPSNVMNRPPRGRDEPILYVRHWVFISVHAALIALSGLLVVMTASRFGLVPRDAVQTVAFLAIAFAQLWHVFNVRGEGSPPLANEITTNPWVWGGGCLSILLTCLIVYVEPARVVFRLAHPGWSGWLVALGASLIPLIGNLVYSLAASGLTRRRG